VRIIPFYFVAGVVVTWFVGMFLWISIAALFGF
jgi:hypothetical protein